MPRNKIRESVHHYNLQLFITSSGAVHNVPLEYSGYLFRCVISLVFGNTISEGFLMSQTQLSLLDVII